MSNELIAPKIQEVQKSDDQSSRTPEQVRLEQNIRFLQDQHQLMLAGLHGEIEKLKARNRGKINMKTTRQVKNHWHSCRSSISTNLWQTTHCFNPNDQFPISFIPRRGD